MGWHWLQSAKLCFFLFLFLTENLPWTSCIGMVLPCRDANAWVVWLYKSQIGLRLLVNILACWEKGMGVCCGSIQSWISSEYSNR